MQDRNAAATRGERRPQDGGELAAAQRRRDHQRVVEQRSMAVERGIDDGLLADETRMIDAGAAAGPAGAAAAEQRRRDGGRRRGIADAHLAEADQIGIAETASAPRATAARNAASSMAGAWVKSAVGSSSASATTRRLAPAVLAS